MKYCAVCILCSGEMLCSVLYCIVLQWDVACDTMFSDVLYRALYAKWYCVVRFAEM